VTMGTHGRRLLVPFAECDETVSLKDIGGKGFSLAQMFSIVKPSSSFTVPDGACVTTAAFDRHLAVCKIDPQLLFQKPTTTLLDSIQKTIMEHDLDPIFQDRIGGFLANQPADRTFAVRSSGTAEDGVEHSFAGQYETLLNVSGTVEALGQAVKACWASQFRDSVLDYLKAALAKGTPGRVPLMGVVIQTMINPKSAGVLFAVDNTTSISHHVVVNGAWGLGEAIVSGEVSGHTATVDWTTSPCTIVKKDFSPQEKKMVCLAKAGQGTMSKEAFAEMIQTVDTTPEERSTSPFDGPNVWRRLCDMGLDASSHYGLPQDVEWAFDADDQLFLLQSRPITVFNMTPEQGAWQCLKVLTLATLALCRPSENTAAAYQILM